MQIPHHFRLGRRADGDLSLRLKSAFPLQIVTMATLHDAKRKNVKQPIQQKQERGVAVGRRECLCPPRHVTDSGSSARKKPLIPRFPRLKRKETRMSEQLDSTKLSVTNADQAAYYKYLVTGKSNLL